MILNEVNKRYKISPEILQKYENWKLKNSVKQVGLSAVSDKNKGGRRIWKHSS